MKSFGSQWLNDWEDAHEPDEPFVPPPPDPRALIMADTVGINGEETGRLNHPQAERMLALKVFTDG